MAGQRALASGSCGALPLVRGVCWGVTAEKASRNARDVTAGKMGRNSSDDNPSTVSFMDEFGDE